MTAALAVAAAGLVAAPTAANAVVTDELAVTNAEFAWAVNHESTGGAYFGACNFLAAGEAGNTGSARVWTDADGFYKTSDGNVTVVKPDAEGTYAQAAWADKCKNRLGTSVAAKTSGLTFTTGGVTQPSYTEAEVRIAGGTGTVNPVTDSGTISWDGAFTIAYYGGMTYWTITDPVLTLENGHGSITGTFSGYGADMDNPEVWTTLTPVTATLTDFTTATVDVTDTGFEVTPDYLGVDTTADGRNPQAEPTTDNQSWWGAFPTSWIEFNLATGQDSYWYTTAGTATSIQPRKVAAPVAVAYTGTPIETEEPVDPVLENTALPTTYGTAKVGKDVIARTGSWSETPDSVSYRWLRDGKAISGATKSRYTVTATDTGKKLQVEVTATKAGFPTTAATSAKTASVAKGSFTAKTPTISGTKKVGKTLKVSVGSWSPKATKYSYRWYANGKAISGGVKASLKLTKSQQGKRITVKVTGTKTGYTTVSKTSSKTGKVAKR